MPVNKNRTTDAVEILHRRFYQGNPARLESLEEARAKEEIARKIRELRTKAGLTQAQLARVVGTTPSAICRLAAYHTPAKVSTMRDRTCGFAGGRRSNRQRPRTGAHPSQPIHTESDRLSEEIDDLSFVS